MIDLQHLYDPKHPLKSPILGRLVSKTVCAMGHDFVMMELDTWEEPWITCSICGARTIPKSYLE
jgi:hypothetical protein